jgi:hypothetical protein
MAFDRTTEAAFDTTGQADTEDQYTMSPSTCETTLADRMLLWR